MRQKILEIQRYLVPRYVRYVPVRHSIHFNICHISCQCGVSLLPYLPYDLYYKIDIHSDWSSHGLYTQIYNFVQNISCDQPRQGCFWYRNVIRIHWNQWRPHWHWHSIRDWQWNEQPLMGVLNQLHPRDDVIKGKRFPRHWPFVRRIGEFPLQKATTRSFDVFFDLRLNRRVNKQSCGQWFDTPLRSLWRQCNDSSIFSGLVSYLSKMFSLFQVSHDVHIWWLSAQLSCNDTCLTWMWFKGFDRYFCQSKELRNRNIWTQQHW